MDDLISRQTAIDAVYERIRQIGYENYLHVLSIEQAIRDLPSAQSEQQWIPVTERLPEIGEYVLCMIRQRYRGRFHVCHYVDKDKYVSHPYFDWQHNGFPDVVAWMPLPEPYQEGEQDG